jgi:uncharacterized protein (DUF433 family)
MELVFVFLFLFLWIGTTIFLGFWIKNLISKLKSMAEKKEEFDNILNEYTLLLEQVYNNDLYGGLPIFKETKLYTENLMKYINFNLNQDEIGFIYDNDKK